MCNTWTVVKFINEDTVEAVPSDWVIGNTCYWPPTTNQKKILLAIKKHELPSTCWPQFNISLFKNGIFDNYIDARKKTKVAEYSSDLNGEEERNSRKFRHRKEKSSSESEIEEERIPEPPRRHVTSNKSERKAEFSQSAVHEKVIGLFDDCQTEADSCICCPIHKKDLLEQKELLLSLTENINSISRKMNMLLNISTDAVEHLRDLKKDVNLINFTTETSAGNDGGSVLTKFNIPIKTMEVFLELEEHLAVEANFAKCIIELCKIGGNNTYDFIRRVMSLIMTNNLAQNFTWFGTKEKQSFQKLKVAEAVVKAAERCMKSDLKSTEEAVKKYLRRAKERSMFENKKLKDSMNSV